MAWRREKNIRDGFEHLRKRKPLLAIGADRPLEDEMLMADYFHGIDGLGGVHTSVRSPRSTCLRKRARARATAKFTNACTIIQHQHHTAPETWKNLFSSPPPPNLLSKTAEDEIQTDHSISSPLFTPSQKPSHLEILRLLDENPPDTISIIAIGPLTNLALAAAESPQTLLKAKSIIVMGGAVNVPGNMPPSFISLLRSQSNSQEQTPLAEFNTYADTTAAARLYALTSPNPASTMPPTPPPPPSQPDPSSSTSTSTSTSKSLPPYPPPSTLGPKRLSIILFPLDITTRHKLHRSTFEQKLTPLITRGSPLAEWTSAFMTSTFSNIESLHEGHSGHTTSLSLHDPMCIWYALDLDHDHDLESSSKNWQILPNQDIRVETAGQWTRGACVVDRRDRKKPRREEGDGSHDNDNDPSNDVSVPGDHDGWLDWRKGNRLGLCVGTPGEGILAGKMLDVIFGE
ncbi:hypothetical protein MMC09_003497 [Bachmanniomyces sp. S44760]|nr:hypothetical protein [Bachmanniomyces sp. S44760]